MPREEDVVSIMVLFVGSAVVVVAIARLITNAIASSALLRLRRGMVSCGLRAKLLATSREKN